MLSWAVRLLPGSCTQFANWTQAPSHVLSDDKVSAAES